MPRTTFILQTQRELDESAIRSLLNVLIAAAPGSLHAVAVAPWEGPRSMIIEGTPSGTSKVRP